MINAINLKGIIFSILIVSVTVLSTILFSRLSTHAQETTESVPRIGYTVVLDAGHGGVDPGSIGRKTKITESELNLVFVNKLEKLLVASGIDVVKTRKDEHGLYGIYSKDYKTKDMKARKDIITTSNANLMVSIHMNSFTSSNLRGAQVFYSEGNQNSGLLSLSIQNAFKSDLPESNKGISIGDYYILKCDNSIPSVLCECGYLSNAEDEQLLTTEEYQDKVVYAIYKGIIAFINQ